MKIVLSKTIVIIITCLFSVFLTANASAFTLEDIKSAGIVGEKEDGLLAIVDENVKGKDISKIKTFVDDINQKRMQKYLDLSKKNAIKVEQIQLLTGTKVIEKAPKGTYIMHKGKWIKKNN